MFTVIYSFEVIPNKEDDFKTGWKGLTELIYQYENSYGSRLHKLNNHSYIAYAAWPDKETWKNSGKNLPEKANEFYALMKASCSNTKVEYTLDVIEDLLQPTQFKNKATP